MKSHICTIFFYLTFICVEAKAADVEDTSGLNLVIDIESVLLLVAKQEQSHRSAYFINFIRYVAQNFRFGFFSSALERRNLQDLIHLDQWVPEASGNMTIFSDEDLVIWPERHDYFEKVCDVEHHDRIYLVSILFSARDRFTWNELDVMKNLSAEHVAHVFINALRDEGLLKIDFRVKGFAKNTIIIGTNPAWVHSSQRDHFLYIDEFCELPSVIGVLKKLHLMNQKGHSVCSAIKILRTQGLKVSRTSERISYSNM